MTGPTKEWYVATFICLLISFSNSFLVDARGTDKKIKAMIKMVNQKQRIKRRRKWRSNRPQAYKKEKQEIGE